MRVAENLNAALHSLLAARPDLYVLGEDILDPYGGAFKITKGLSSRFPDRVLTTPISENAITGVAAGLALAGDEAIVEMMFGDFIALAFDQLVNFASKSVTMYGSRLPLRMVVRCPVGGGRGYGPTHSQSPQKHFIGIPNLALYEVSPFRDNLEVFAEMLGRGEPCILFEGKVLYTRQMHAVPEPFTVRLDDGVATVFVEKNPDFVLIAPGGMAYQALEAMQTLLMEDDLLGTLIVPSRLYPFEVDVPDVPYLFVVEESTAGGTWGAEVALGLNQERWGRLAQPVTVIHSQDSIIPAAVHLEDQVLANEAAIRRVIKETLRG
ncbi:alpha-ketoacid dehydrogenase subunit beta [Nonomuraea turkmeniaca]|uniref:Pyruvate dehydrogenase E1 component subunit beta n=1 Tax=Nonomuraea turkmeniaca TaxID=103838 RepID=A0A5S4FSZ3_9ACTN|nr:alpha-ketoacid dehydrogenase subunit beta [Nonomuraea turkmeniaca]TMR23753.1 alpha-ketoacid dehydrogenase subunit beta [Nonomuraea turkmeniaca]